MIEINLTQNRKGFGKKKAGGALDLKKVNTKFVIVGLVLLYGPDFFIQDYFREQKEIVSGQIKVITIKNKKILKELKEVKALRSQVQEHKAKEKKLKEKLEIVKEIINNRRNPFQILLYISKNIPETVWLNNFKIEENKLILKGTAKSYKSIGTFTNNLKNSIFFSFVTYRQAAEADEDKRVSKDFSESFEIVANIARYE